MIIRAPVVAPLCCAPIENGAVLVDEVSGTICAVDHFSQFKAQPQETIIDLEGCVLTPGLINVHCHLEYTHLTIPSTPDFGNWLEQIIAAKRQSTTEDFIRATEAGAHEMLRSGITSALNILSHFPLLEKLPPCPLRLWWCLELIDIREKISVHLLARQLRNWWKQRPDWRGGLGLSPHAPYTASRSVYRQAWEWCADHQWIYTTHLHESEGERDSSPAPAPHINNPSTLHWLLEKAPPELTPLLVHCNYTSAEEKEALRQKKWPIVHCPLTHSFFHRDPFPLQDWLATETPLCVATDSKASSSSLSLWENLRHLADQHPGVSPSDLLATVTLHPAKALGLAHRIGQISPGAWADLAAFPLTTDTTCCHETLLGEATQCSWMMIAGQPVAHDQ